MTKLLDETQCPKRQSEEWGIPLVFGHTAMHLLNNYFLEKKIFSVFLGKYRLNI